MLTFTCPTCHVEYDCQLVGNRVIYQAGNKRVELKREDQDCSECETEIQSESEKIIAQAREKVRARKNSKDSLLTNIKAV